MAEMHEEKNIKEMAILYIYITSFVSLSVLMALFVGKAIESELYVKQVQLYLTLLSIFLE